MGSVQMLRLYRPHAAQLQIHRSLARYRVAAWGRQSGKSTCCLNELLSYAWCNPGVTLWFVSPTYPQAKVQYRRMLGMLWRCRAVLLKKNQSELRLKLINGSQIRFVSGANFDNLRGETLHGVVIDEMREQHPDLWPLVIRPMLSTTRGWALFVSTPNGFDEFYELFEQARLDRTGTWEAFAAPSTANPLFTEEEAKAARSNMTEDQFAQEILAQFRELNVGRVYKNYSVENERLTCPFGGNKINGLWSPHLPIILAPDFNVNPMVWEFGQEKAQDFWWFDELFVENTNTQECAPEMVKRIKAMRDAGHRAPVAVRICGDPSGTARRSSASESDYAIITGALRDASIPFENITPKEAPGVKDRVNNVNAKWKSADGQRHMWLHPDNCPALKKDSLRVVWKKGMDGVIDKKKNPALTHASDAIGYPVSEIAPIPTIHEVGRLRVIARTR